MKTFLQKTILLVLAIAVLYVLVFSIERVGSGRICAVEDLRTEKIVRVVRPCAAGLAFVWEGVLPWWYLLYEMPVRRTAAFTVMVGIPGLEGLAQAYYRVGIPLRVTYRIDPDRLTEQEGLARGGKALDGLVASYFREEVATAVTPLLAPVYQREALVAKTEEIVAGAAKTLGPELKSIGIVLEGVRPAGMASLPDRIIVNEGILHAADLRRIDKEHQKELIGAKSRIEREGMRNEHLYSKLREMSRIISGNPDILKYIYIDKMAADVKVILSSDASGVPRMLEREVKPARATRLKPGEVDNLR